jgi:hypothetical protein
VHARKNGTREKQDGVGNEKRGRKATLGSDSLKGYSKASAKRISRAVYCGYYV